MKINPIQAQTGKTKSWYLIVLARAEKASKVRATKKGKNRSVLWGWK